MENFSTILVPTFYKSRNILLYTGLILKIISGSKKIFVFKDYKIFSLCISPFLNGLLSGKSFVASVAIDLCIVLRFSFGQMASAFI